MDLAGKHCIITGAASGIGAACARRFAADGAKVAVVDVNADGAAAVAEEVGGIAVACDLGDAAAIDAMVDQVRTEFGSIDVLFNNAGIASGKGPLDSPLDEWQRQWDVNLMSHVHAIRGVLPEMLERGSGYILYTASMAGILSSHGNLPYAVSKHAVVGLAEWMAFTYDHLGVKNSLLAPLVVRTPMLGSAADSAWATQAGGPLKEPEAKDSSFNKIWRISRRRELRQSPSFTTLSMQSLLFLSAPSLASTPLRRPVGFTPASRGQPRFSLTAA